MAVPQVDYIAIDDEERTALLRLTLDIESAGAVTVSAGGTNVELPAGAARAVRQLLRDLASGSPVHLVPADAELTTQQAADLLGISRTYVVRLVDQGDLAAHLVGTHRRLLAADVLAYRQMRQDRLDAVAAITDADLEADVQY